MSSLHQQQEQGANTSSKYSLADLQISDLRSLAPQQRNEFFDWIESMTPEIDNELGKSEDPNEVTFSIWLREHENVLEDQTYVYLNQQGKIIATASLIIRDREVEADPNGRVLGGLNVHRDLRNKGIGQAVMEHIENLAQGFANETGESVPVKLFTADARARHIYEKLGYLRIEDAEVIDNYTGGESEVQYRKIYSPAKLEMPELDPLGFNAQG